MATITFTIPDAKLQRVIDATKWAHKIPVIDVGTESASEYENEFTDAQWAKEAWRRQIVAQVKRYESYLAKQAVDVPADDDLIS